MAASSEKGTESAEARRQAPRTGSVDPAEVAAFEALAARWWDPDGPFRPLHRFNPARIAFIRDRIAAHFGRGAEAEAPLNGLDLLDIGTGGGLVAEPMTRLGATVLGIDPSAGNIAAARAHAAEMALDIAYRPAAAEDLVAEGLDFDVVLALEVVEHVSDLAAFLAAAAALVRPGGVLIASTLNRTARSYALAILGAEYILGWLPRGTHDWSRFVKPDELSQALARAGLRVETLSGLSFNPLTATWRVTPDTGVNYAVVATKAP